MALRTRSYQSGNAPEDNWRDATPLHYETLLKASGKYDASAIELVSVIETDESGNATKFLIQYRNSAGGWGNSSISPDWVIEFRDVNISNVDTVEINGKQYIVGIAQVARIVGMSQGALYRLVSDAQYRAAHFPSTLEGVRLERDKGKAGRPPLLFLLEEVQAYKPRVRGNPNFSKQKTQA